MCGEKLNIQRNHVNVTGSPPRVRGKGFLIFSAVRLAGITPACAGKSIQRLQQVGYTEDHPRVCGEKTPSIMLPVSSGWITPACAGKRFFDIFGG